MPRSVAAPGAPRPGAPRRRRSTSRALVAGWVLVAGVTAASGGAWGGAAEAAAQERDGDLRVARRDGTARQQVFGNVLSRAVGLRLVSVQAVLHRARWGGRTFEGTGPCVQLDGVEVTRLLFDRPLDALEYLVHVARPGRTPLVADARGRQLVMVSGRRLLTPERAARVLTAAWADEVLDAPERPIEALRVASPPLDEAAAAGVAFDAALFLGRGDTPAWTHTLEKLRVARLYAGESAGDPARAGPVVRFVSTNHFVFEPAAGGFSEVAMTRHAAVDVVGRGADRCRALAVFGRDLLEVLTTDGEPEEAPRRRMLVVVQELLAPPGEAPATPPDELGAPPRPDAPR
ncbi:MAG: hypothetical protein M9894_34885 [Planctomycetes bacterium]|nr:hypothetical protein [Planctomycetota bacterium]